MSIPSQEIRMLTLWKKGGPYFFLRQRWVQTIKELKEGGIERGREKEKRRKRKICSGDNSDIENRIDDKVVIVS